MKIPWLPFFKYAWTATFGWNKRPLAEFLTCATVWACVWWGEISYVTLPQQLSQRSSAAQSVSCLSNTPLIIQRERERLWATLISNTEQIRESKRDVEMEIEIILSNDVGMCGLCNGRTPWSCSPMQNSPTPCGLPWVVARVLLCGCLQA